MVVVKGKAVAAIGVVVAMAYQFLLPPGRRRTTTKKAKPTILTSYTCPDNDAICEIALQAVEEAKEDPDFRQMLDGDYQLIGARVNSTLLDTLSKSPSEYAGIVLTFCDIDTSIQKEDPAAVPMQQSMLNMAQRCRFENYKVDLYKAVTLARAYDAQVAKDPAFATLLFHQWRLDAEQEQEEGDEAVEEDDEIRYPKPLEISGVIFHEARVGSTMVSNAFVAANPAKHVSLSETQPPKDVINGLCGDQGVGTGKHVPEDVKMDRANMHHVCQRPEYVPHVLRDTMYMQSRSNDPKEEKVLFKFLPEENFVIPLFEQAFPDVPWIFLFRDPVQVLMSYSKHSSHLLNHWCNARRHYPGRMLTEWAIQHDMDVKAYTTGTSTAWSALEFCALVVSHVVEGALQHFVSHKGKPSKGVAVDYQDLKQPSTVEAIFSDHFGIKLTAKEMELMKVSLGTYSKGDANEKQKKWEGDDSSKKTKEATPEIKELATKLLQDSYDKLSVVRSFRTS